METIQDGCLLEVPEGANAEDSDRSQDDFDVDDPSVREVLGIIHDIDCVGDGQGEEAEVNEGERVVLNGNEQAEDGPDSMDPETAGDFPVHGVDPDPQHNEVEFENGMTF